MSFISKKVKIGQIIKINLGTFIVMNINKNNLTIIPNF